MSEKFRIDRKIGFQNTFYTKCINVIIDNIGPSIILRSIFQSKKEGKENALFYLNASSELTFKTTRLSTNQRRK